MAPEGSEAADAGLKSLPDHSLFDCEALYSELSSAGHEAWAAELINLAHRALSPGKHGKLQEWTALLKQLPNRPADCRFSAEQDAIVIDGSMADADRRFLETQLRVLHPWRKGPFQVFDISIDTEWRSCMKWDRIAPHLELRNRRILDVGCGNGYYGWRMLSRGAQLVLGIDPFILFLMQFEAIRRFAPPRSGHFVLPLSDADLGACPPFFDVVFSMGVLYHRTSPVDHLQTLGKALKPGGQLVLESLVLDAPDERVLVPEDRYAKMRNVWFIPSVSMLLKWLRRSGFRNSRVLDVTVTTGDEQRKTSWMTFESLSDFLDPKDSRRTIEGYPAPIRAVVLAEKG